MRVGQTWGPTVSSAEKHNERKTTYNIPIRMSPGTRAWSGTGKGINMKFKHSGKLQLRKKLRQGTWNVQSKIQLGKLQLLGQELERR